MTDEILPDGEDGSDTPASKPAPPRKSSRARTPTAKAAKPAQATDLGKTGSPASRAKAKTVRSEGAPVEEDIDDADGSAEGDAGPATVANGPSPDDEAVPTPASGVLGGDEDEDDDDLDAVVGDDGKSYAWLTSVRRWVVSNRATTLVGVVAVALAVALILTLLSLSDRNALDSARTSAVSAARTDAVALAGYDYRQLNRDFGAVLAVSTPSFRRSFSQSSDALKTTLSKYHAIAVAHVVSAGLVSVSTSRAVVLVFLTQKVSNTTQKTSSTERSQVEMTLFRSGGRWLIDQVNLL